MRVAIIVLLFATVFALLSHRADAKGNKPKKTKSPTTARPTEQPTTARPTKLPTLKPTPEGLTCVCSSAAPPAQWGGSARSELLTTTLLSLWSGAKMCMLAGLVTRDSAT
jgi:hypothetical protein